MRTSELISALACREPGVQAVINPQDASIRTLYHPDLRGFGKTLFDAALDLAKQMISDPDCPLDVKKALECYDERTCFLAL